jgi:hypothetical protein
MKGLIIVACAIAIVTVCSARSHRVGTTVTGMRQSFTDLPVSVDLASSPLLSALPRPQKTTVRRARVTPSRTVQSSPEPTWVCGEARALHQGTGTVRECRWVG